MKCKNHSYESIEKKIRGGYCCGVEAETGAISIEEKRGNRSVSAEKHATESTTNAHGFSTTEPHAKQNPPNPTPTSVHQ